MARSFDALPEPATLRAHFTRTGYVKNDRPTSFQVLAEPDGRIAIWTVGPLGWWHNFQMIPADTSFDDALRLTYLPRFYGWER